jgi:Uncharacterised protein family (UPF0158)
MTPVPVVWPDLETAFERNSPDMSSFLNIETGEVLMLVDSTPGDESRRSNALMQPEIYTSIDPASSREQYRWMERFVTSVEDETLRERLIIAIDGKGAFRRFKDVLLHYPGERERWFSYRADLLHAFINEWLVENSIETGTTPPWGDVTPPPEPDQPLTRPAQGAISPAEVLRRQAKELIDVIPAVDLTAAIAFLDFLRDRGSSNLVARDHVPRPSSSQVNSYEPEQLD